MWGIMTIVLLSPFLLTEGAGKRAFAKVRKPTGWGLCRVAPFSCELNNPALIAIGMLGPAG